MNLAAIPAGEPDAPALLHDGAAVTYAELDRYAAAAAELLRERGVEPGDRVALLAPNSPAWAAWFLGILRLGAIVVPLNPLLAPQEIEERVALAGAKLVLRDVTLPSPRPDQRHESVTRDDGDPAVVLFTSGTSGRPKGAILTHGGIATAARYAADALAFAPGDVVLGAAPFSHVLGLSTGLVGSLAAGAAVAVVERFDAERTLATMARTRTTVLLGVPTMCIALCEAARGATELPPVRIAHVGGAPVPQEVARAFERVFGGEVYEGYGLTELSGIATTYRRGQTRRPGSVGMPLGETQVRIGELGEVQFRGPSVTPGYWDDPAATAAAFDDGWLRTGDVGRLDDEGYLYLSDRLTEMIVRGGYNVFPREVEEALYAHPDVLEAAVVGVPDERLGEEVGALVVLRPGAGAGPDELREWTRGRIAAYKLPRRIAIVDELPKGPTGKVLKRAIDRSPLRSY